MGKRGCEFWARGQGWGEWSKGESGEGFYGDEVFAVRFDLGDEVIAQTFHGLGHASDVSGFGDIIIRPDGKRFDGDLGPPLHERAEHDDGKLWIELSNFAEGLNAIHLRHLDIEGDDVGGDLGDFLEGDLAVGSDSDDFDGGVGGQDIGDHAAHDHRIIDHEHSDLRHSVRWREWGLFDHAEDTQFVGDHFFGNRLHEIVIGSRVEGFDDGGQAALGGDHHELHIGIGRVGADIFDEFETIHSGHIPVDEGDIEGVALFEHIEGILAVAGFLGLE